MTYEPDTQQEPKTYSSDRAGLQEAARNLTEHETERAEPEAAPEPVEVPYAPPAEEKKPVSLNEWKKERAAEREAFAAFREEQESAAAPDEAEDFPAEDPDDLLIAKLTEPNGTISPEDYRRALELSDKRLEGKLYEAQVANANAVIEARSRMQAASSTFGIMQQQLRAEFQNRFGADLSDEAALRGVLENQQTGLAVC